MSRRREVRNEIRNRLDVVELVGSYFPLRRTGQNFKACCPFHDEKTPSFVVSPQRQTFHCFGCGEKGTIFDFVMKMERVEFREALELLADKAGVPLEDDAEEGRARRSLRAELYRLHEWTHGLFQRAYAAPEGAACRRYVDGRGITPEIVQSFGVGYAPPGWETLVDEARRAGYPPALLEKAGLARQSSRRPGHFSMFRDRLVFTIRDSMGRVVAFGARSLDGSEPKYLNSPETEIFQKGRILFGLDRLRHHGREDPVFVMEGYTDVLMSEQVGVTGAVATLGTALTPDHANVLSRYSDSIVLVYDGDSAGLAAAERGTMLLLEAGHLDIKVTVLPEGQDPCDFFRERGADGKAELLDRTIDLLQFLLDRAAARWDLESADGRRRAAEALVGAAAAIKDPIARDVVLDRISDRTGVGVYALRDEVARRRSGAPRRPRPQVQAPEVPTDDRLPVQPLDRANREVAEALVNAPGLVTHAALSELPPVLDPRVRELIRVASEEVEKIAGSPGHLLDLVEEPTTREAARTVLLPEGHGRDLAAQLEGAMRWLKNKGALEEARRLSREAVDSGDAGLLGDIQRRFQTLKGGSRRTDSTEDGSRR